MKSGPKKTTNIVRVSLIDILLERETFPVDLNKKSEMRNIKFWIMFMYLAGGKKIF